MSQPLHVVEDLLVLGLPILDLAGSAGTGDVLLVRHTEERPQDEVALGAVDEDLERVLLVHGITPSG